MATLEFSSAGGTISASVSASDAKAIQIVDLYLDTIGYDITDMTNQEKADAFVNELISHVQSAAKNQVVRKNTRSAEAAAREEVRGIEWTDAV